MACCREVQKGTAECNGATGVEVSRRPDTAGLRCRNRRASVCAIVQLCKQRSETHRDRSELRSELTAQQSALHDFDALSIYDDDKL